MRLACEDLAFTYPAARGEALSGVSLDVFAGELVACVGPSGSGKSTLLLALAALLRPAGGTVTLDGRDVFGADLVAMRRRLGVVFQFPETQLFGASVAEELSFGPRQAKLPADDVRVRVEQALVDVGLGEEMLSRSPFSLSGGEQRRVAIAAALATRPDVLLFDEPTAGLDASGREALLALVRRLVDDGRGALVVSHDAGPLLAVSDRAVVLSGGRVVWDGPAVDLRASAGLAARLGVSLAPQDAIAAALRARGWEIEVETAWTAQALARAIARERP